jgi:hypothetical protein
MLRRRLALGFGVFLFLVGGSTVGWADDEADAPSLLKGVYDNGFRFDSADGKFSLRLNAGIQLRYTYVDYDEQVLGNEENYSNFYMRRARLWWVGHVLDPRFSYFFHIQLEPTRSINAHDLWLEYRFSELLRLGVGRNKIAYGLEFLNSGGRLAFVERSVMYGETDIDWNSDGPEYPGGGTERFGLSWFADTGFATGGLGPYRSQGVQLQGKRGASDRPTFEYQLGVWNGRSTVGLSNSTDSHLYSARVGYHPWGFVDWMYQGDGENSPRYTMGLLLSAYTNSSDQGGGYDEIAYNLAVMNRYRGFSADLEWGFESYDFDIHSSDFDREGWRVHLGYHLKPRVFEVVARYAQIERLKDPSYRKAVDSGLGVPELHSGDGTVLALERRISEVSVGFNWFINAWHQHKLQLDLSRLVREFAADPDAVIDDQPSPIAAADDQEDYRLRVMIQLYF